MSQQSQRTPLGSFTIVVNREDTNLMSQMTVQHIVKPMAAEKRSEAILARDLDLTKFIIYLMIDVEYDMILDHIEYWLPDTGTIELLVLEERVFQTVISKMYNGLWRTRQSEIQFRVPSRNYQTGYLPRIETSAPFDCADFIPRFLDEAPLAAEKCISEVGSISKQSTWDSACTLEIGHGELPADELSPRNIKGWKWVLVVCAILSSLFLYALDNTIVASIQPAIVETFEDVGKLSWLGVAFRLGAASTNLIWAKAYGNFNTKRVYVLSLFLFEAGSIMCGTSTNISTLIVGRAISGVGGVGLYIGVITLLSISTSTRERPNYIALTGIVWGLGTVLGPIVGGAFTDSVATWRWAFYINPCLGGLFVPIYFILLPSIDPQPGKLFSKRVREMDVLGGILLMGAFVSGIMAITFGGTLYQWTSAQIIGCFLTSGALFIAFGFQQAHPFLITKEQRIFPVEFLKSRMMVLLFCSMSCASAGLFIPIYMVPLFFQFTRSDAALDAAMRLLPFIILSVFACLVNGSLMSKYGYYVLWYLTAGIFTTIGATLMSIVIAQTNTSQVYGSTILLGFGIGLVYQASFSVAQTIAPAAKTSDVVGFIACAQISSGTISLAAANSIFLNEAQNRIQALLPDASLSTIQGAIAGVDSSFVASLSSEMRNSIVEAIVQSMGKVYILEISAGVFLILLSIGLRGKWLS